jgi:hypothetical protein
MAFGGPNVTSLAGVNSGNGSVTVSANPGSGPACAVVASVRLTG